MLKIPENTFVISLGSTQNHYDSQGPEEENISEIYGLMKPAKVNFLPTIESKTSQTSKSVKNIGYPRISKSVDFDEKFRDKINPMHEKNLSIFLNKIEKNREKR